MTLGPLRAGDALVLIDVQRDFLPGGALAVPGAERVIGPLNACLGEFARQGLPVYATRDWHPPDHRSFRLQGGRWPAHCVAGTAGAAFSPQLALPSGAHVISKGVEPDTEGYSGFERTALAAQLRADGCRRLFIGGLATDYCVQATAHDAREAGFEVLILGDAVQAVDASPGDGARALAALESEGIRIIQSAQIRA
jgi:nicotinamidase/pyrazinamidase